MSKDGLFSQENQLFIHKCYHSSMKDLFGIYRIFTVVIRLDNSWRAFWLLNMLLWAKPSYETLTVLIIKWQNTLYN